MSRQGKILYSGQPGVFRAGPFYFMGVQDLAGGGKGGVVVDKAIPNLLENGIALFNLTLKGGKIEI
jgi:hypothetical protein